MSTTTRAQQRRFIIWYFLVNALVFCVVGVSYLNHILLSDSLFIDFNTNIEYVHLNGKGYVLFFTLVNYVCYMTFLAAFPAFVLWLVSLIFPSRYVIGLLSPIIAALGVTLLLIDTRVYSMFHFHLNLVFLEIIFNKHNITFFDFGSLELVLISAVVFSILALEYGLAILVWKKIVNEGRMRYGHVIGGAWFCGALFSYATLCTTMAQASNVFSQQLPCLPLYEQVFAYIAPTKNGKEYVSRNVEYGFVQPSLSRQALRYPVRPLHCRPPAKPYNIILLMVDALRFDAVTDVVMPNLTRFGRENLQFNHYLSAGNGTQPGVFSLFYSIPPTYWTAVLTHHMSPILIDQLQAQGYLIQPFWASQIASPPFDKTLFQRVDDVPIDIAPGLKSIPDRDRLITEKARKFLQKQQHKQPFFLTLFYDAVHGNCADQNYPTPFQPTAMCSRFHVSNDMDPKPYRNRYLNAAHFVDTEIGKLLETMKNLGYLENSIVLVTADHGEEFNDNHQNFWGHASNFTDAQLHVPLLIHWPLQSVRMIDYTTSSYDVVPTLLQDALGCENPTEDYSIGRHLLSDKHRNTFVLAGSYINVGLVEAERLTTLQASGQILVTNKQGAPLPQTKPNASLMQQAMNLMRKYYVQYDDRRDISVQR